MGRVQVTRELTTDADDEVRDPLVEMKALAALLRETAAHHGPYEATAPAGHWSDWYAAYVVARQHGRSPSEAVEAAGWHLEVTLR